MAAASSLFTPSLIGLGAPSTRSLASLRPSAVISRTTLMTLILLPPISVSVTVNSVFSSAAARRHHHRHRGRGRHAEFGFEGLHQLRELQHADALDVLHHLLLCHFGH